MRKYVSIFLAAAVIVLGILAPVYIHFGITVNSDMSKYDSNNKLQSLHDAWLNTNEAKQLISQEPKQSKPAIFQHLGLNVPYSSNVPSDVDDIAWAKAGNRAEIGWQQTYHDKIDLDNMVLFLDKWISYSFILLSIAYWILIWGLVYKVKKPTLQD